MFLALYYHTSHTKIQDLSLIVMCPINSLRFNFLGVFRSRARNARRNPGPDWASGTVYKEFGGEDGDTITEDMAHEIVRKLWAWLPPRRSTTGLKETKDAEKRKEEL